MNGRVFRASGLEGDVAVKFVVRDQPDRAGREWAALTILAQHLDTLPLQPPLLIRDNYQQQAIVQSWPRWPRPPLQFCRGDLNIRNFIRRPHSWASVDWEYSGWGDPAFEKADVLVHAAHISWPRRQTRRLLDLYCAHNNDTAISSRIGVYETHMLIWWTFRLGRFLQEALSGRD